MHVPRPKRSYRFGTYDRIVHQGRAYRYIGKVDRVHVLQLVNGDVVEDHFVRLSDEQIDKARERKQFTHEVGFYSLIETKLRVRNDDSDLKDLNDGQLAAIHWRHRWVREFLRLEAEHGNEGRSRVGRSPRLMSKAIELLAGPVLKWYEETFEQGRRERRVAWTMPTPSASTLYAAVRAYEKGGYKIGALRSGRSRCGNRNQLAPEVRDVIDAACEQYMTRAKPVKARVVQDVHDAVALLNSTRSPGERLCLPAPRIVRKRIDALDPFAVKLGREGEDAAVRWFALVGKGVPCKRPMQRVEIDDWEFDLQTLLCTRETLAYLSKQEIAALQRRRCTLTVAIDCCTSAIVGINLSEERPSAATAIACLRSLSTDKTELARQAGCGGGWPMHGRPAQIVTDKGPAFRFEFEEVVRQLRSGRSIPDADPRMRGHIERFFGTMARTFPTWFTGATQSDVVAKGDYAAEAFASLTFDELFLFVVRWIVDVYHLTPHVALERLTPRDVWDRLAGDDEGIELPLSDDERRRIFGFRESRKVSCEGILFCNVYYLSDEIGWLLQHRPQRKVDVLVDPDDLGSILLVVPKDVRDRDAFGGRRYVDVPCLEPEMRGLTLASWLLAQKEVRDFAREQAEIHDPIRIQARIDLFKGGLKAMIAAGISDHVLTQKTYDRVMRVVDQKGRAALSNPADRLPDLGDSEPYGRLVARAPERPTVVAPSDVVRRRRRADRPAPEPEVPAKAKPMQTRFDEEDDL
nr:Mu transposase C-terminal domain-containing protein [Aureimonas jatrophae]